MMRRPGGSSSRALVRFVEECKTLKRGLSQVAQLAGHESRRVNGRLSAQQLGRDRSRARAF
jgi:hypothetical protein